MAELIHKHTKQVQDLRGVVYNVFISGKPRPGGTWEGWIEFHPVGDTGNVLRTGRETSQPNRAALQYWATGLEPAYLEGAFERAH